MASFFEVHIKKSQAEVGIPSSAFSYPPGNTAHYLDFSGLVLPSEALGFF